MSLETAIRLVCDLCKMPSESHDGGPANRMAALTELRELGWGYRYSYLAAEDLCPTCAAKEQGATA